MNRCSNVKREKNVPMPKMSRVIVGATLIIALAIPAGAAAKTANFAGDIDGGGKIGITATLKKGKPREIIAVRVADVPATCDESGVVPVQLAFGASIKVAKSGKFKGSFKQPEFGNVSTIKGRFKPRKVSGGKFSYNRHFEGSEDSPAEDCRSGKLGYEAVLGADDPTGG
jgi:hypothetical protein